jgi:hypothetical protein
LGEFELAKFKAVLLYEKVIDAKDENEAIEMLFQSWNDVVINGEERDYIDVEGTECKQCGGSGKVPERLEANELHFFTCDVCKGSGKADWAKPDGTPTTKKSSPADLFP